MQHNHNKNATEMLFLYKKTTDTNQACPFSRSALVSNSSSYDVAIDAELRTRCN